MSESFKICIAAAALIALAGCANNSITEQPPRESEAAPASDSVSANSQPETEPQTAADDPNAPSYTEAPEVKVEGEDLPDPENSDPNVMYATDTLNIRTEPSTDGEIVGQYHKGDKVDVTGPVENGWYPVNFGEGGYYVSGDYLSHENPVTAELPDDYWFSQDSDYCFVVNKEILLPEGYEIETDYVQGNYQLEKVAAMHAREMIEAAHQDGIELKILSAYRTVDYQQGLIDKGIKNRMENQGMTYDEAAYDVSINIAPPGGSEHNAGLAADIIDYDHWDTYEEFEDTPEFDWLIEHCWEYGFILRYPKGKEDITGYIYEPWHYRYVGTDRAKEVMDSGLCLEEFLGVGV